MEITKFEEPLRYIDSINEGIMQCNQSLKHLVAITRRLTDALPEDWREDPLPIRVTLKTAVREATNAKKSENTVLLKEKERIRRGMSWQRAVGNKLGITKEHLNKYLELSEFRKKEVTETPTEFASYVKLIGLDVARTFSIMDVIQFKYNFATQPSGAVTVSPKLFHEELIQLLEAYAIYRPAVGYAQGMSHIAGMLLLHMNKVDAFVCLCNLSNNHFFLSLFKMDVPEINRHVSVYDFLFTDQLPALYEHFRKHEIYPEQYLLSWLSTIFTLSLPFDVACKVWDQFLAHGEIYLYRTALGILRFFSSHLLKSTFEETLHLLKHLPQDLDQLDLLQSIEAVEVAPYIHNFVSKIDVPLTKPY